MLCKEVSELLPDFSVGMVGDRQAAAIQGHLNGCAGCRAELQALEQVPVLIEQFGAVQAPEGLFDAVRHQIVSGQAVQDRPWWFIFFGRPARAAAMGLSVASVALGLLLPVGRVSQVPRVELHPAPIYGSAGSARASSELANSIRQHAMNAGDGSLNDRVAWEAMAQLVTQESPRAGRRRLEPTLSGEAAPR